MAYAEVLNSFQNSFTRVAGNDAKMGYFPTNLSCVELIASHLNIPGGINIVDPCVGEGDALIQFAKGTTDCKLLGVELSEQRGKACKAKGIETVISGYEDVSVSPGALPLVFMNPPYGMNSNNTRREEEDFLRLITNHITKDGILCYVVPDYILEEKLMKFMYSRYDILLLNRFPLPTYNEFKQCVAILRRKANVSVSDEELASVMEMVANMETLSIGSHEFKVPQTPKDKLNNFHARTWNAESGLAFAAKLCKKTNFVANELEIKDASSIDVGHPLMDLKPDLKWLMLASGVVSGSIGTDKPYEHLQRGRVRNVETIEESDEESDTETVTSHAAVTMKVIERNGTITSLM